MQQVPIISLQQFEQGVLPEQELNGLAKACEDHGFFLLRDHGEDKLIADVFDLSAQFFAQPRADKLQLLRDELNPLGYFDRELTKQKRDLKEVYDFKAGGYISSNPAKQTRWPEDEGFRNKLTDFFATFTSLSERTMLLVFVALGFPKAQAQKLLDDCFGANHSSAARLNYYPKSDPLSMQERKSVNELGDMALHHHTDPGAITLLLQDNHGGLQALSKQDGWIDVTPQPGTIVVNIGDVLQVWSNDRCVAGTHRVLSVQSEVGRYSTPFFYQPKYDAVVEPWVEPGDKANYSAFSWRDYIRGRVTDNFTDVGEDDIQIERYRVAS